MDNELDALNRQTEQKLRQHIRDLETTIYTFLHNLDDHNDEAGPILMSGNMWLQVFAMRELLTDSTSQNAYNAFDDETTRETAYCAVAHALAGIDAADMTVCQNVVDGVLEAVKSVLRG